MELQFLKMARVIVMMTGLVSTLTAAAPVSNDCADGNAMQSYCNEATNSSLINDTLKYLYAKVNSIITQVSKVSFHIAKCICNIMHIYILYQAGGASGTLLRDMCVPINRDFLNRRLSVQLVLLKQRLQELDTSCSTTDGNSKGDANLLHACQTLQDDLRFFSLTLTNYVSYHVTVNSNDHINHHYS